MLTVLKSKRFKNPLFLLFLFSLLTAESQSSDFFKDFVLEQKIPYATVLIKSHYTPEIEELARKKQDKEPFTKEEQDIAKASVGMNGTGFFYIDYPDPDEEFSRITNNFAEQLGEEANSFKEQQKIFINTLLKKKRSAFDCDTRLDCLYKIFSSLKEKKTDDFDIFFKKHMENAEWFLNCINHLEDSGTYRNSLIYFLFHKILSSQGCFENNFEKCGFNSLFSNSKYIENDPSYLFKDSSRLFVVTNKHVLLGKDKKNLQLSTHTHLFFKKSDSESLPLTIECYEQTTDDHEQNIFYHPDYDMCLIDVSREVLKHEIKYIGFTKKDIFFPSKKYTSNEPVLTSLVHMTGYPRAIYDKVNNLPVTRSGTIASPLEANWNGHEEFLTDITVFNGSSGSPVFYLYKEIVPNTEEIDVVEDIDKSTSEVLDPDEEKIDVISGIDIDKTSVIESINSIDQRATKITLLGLLRAGPVFNLSKSDKQNIRVPMGLGIVIKASVLDSFLKSIRNNTYHPIDLNKEKNKIQLEEDEDSAFHDISDIFDDYSM